MKMEQLVEWELLGEPEVLGENLLSAASSTRNPTWHNLGSNLGIRAEKLTPELWHGRPYFLYLYLHYVSINAWTFFSRVRFPMRSLDSSNWPNPSSHNTVLGSTQLLTEVSTRNIPGGKRRPALKADSLTDICEPIV
jgi:hypothetical protein